MRRTRRTLRTVTVPSNARVFGKLVANATRVAEEMCERALRTAD